MTSILDVVHTIEEEIRMADICLANILERMDDDMARIQERKDQIIAEFAARRANLEQAIGASVPRAVVEDKSAPTATAAVMSEE